MVKNNNNNLKKVIYFYIYKINITNKNMPYNISIIGKYKKNR